MSTDFVQALNTAPQAAAGKTPIIGEYDANLGKFVVPMALVSGPTTPTLYTVNMTNANTEYPQALPANCKKFQVILRGDTPPKFRLAFATSKVAASTEPFLEIPAGGGYTVEGVLANSVTVYLACSTAAQVAQIECWV